MKNFLALGLALLGVIVMLYAGLNGLTKDHSYGFFFLFIGSITTIGLGMDLVSHLKTLIRKSWKHVIQKRLATKSAKKGFATTLPFRLPALW